jgi:hypothetical protein
MIAAFRYTAGNPMTNAKHTPGPWESSVSIVENAEERVTIRQKKWGGEIIADMGELEYHNEANARLIAAAPDLLEALEAVESWALDRMGRYESMPPCIRSARIAIAKAEGREA